MTAKQKAFSLYAEYASILNDGRIAKKCALIAVDEILNETFIHDKTTFQHGRTSYWIQVKQEIKKL
jgi:hypothetical protein